MQAGRHAARFLARLGGFRQKAAESAGDAESRPASESGVYSPKAPASPSDGAVAGNAAAAAGGLTAADGSGMEPAATYVHRLSMRSGQHAALRSRQRANSGDEAAKERLALLLADCWRGYKLEEAAAIKLSEERKLELAVVAVEQRHEETRNVEPEASVQLGYNELVASSASPREELPRVGARVVAQALCVSAYKVAAASAKAAAAGATTGNEGPLGGVPNMGRLWWTTLQVEDGIGRSASVPAGDVAKATVNASAAESENSVDAAASPLDGVPNMGRLWWTTLQVEDGIGRNASVHAGVVAEATMTAGTEELETDLDKAAPIPAEDIAEATVACAPSASDVAAVSADDDAAGAANIETSAASAEASDCERAEDASVAAACADVAEASDARGNETEDDAAEATDVRSAADGVAGDVENAGAAEDTRARDVAEYFEIAGASSSPSAAAVAGATQRAGAVSASGLSTPRSAAAAKALVAPLRPKPPPLAPRKPEGPRPRAGRFGPQAKDEPPALVPLILPALVPEAKAWWLTKASLPSAAFAAAAAAAASPPRGRSKQRRKRNGDEAAPRLPHLAPAPPPRHEVALPPRYVLVTAEGRGCSRTSWIEARG